MSVKVGRLTGTKRLRSLRRMNAAIRWRSDALAVWPDLLNIYPGPHIGGRGRVSKDREVAHGYTRDLLGAVY